VAILGTAIITQAVCSRIWHIRFDPKSAAISGLSLCLLLRSNSILWPLAAAVIAVAGKFLVRWRGKHIFNPTNGAIVALMLLTPNVWVSPGQWGNVVFFGFLITCLGGLVVNRAARSDVTYAFIIAWSAILIGRSMMLGEPMTIPIHRLENGALLLFTFFMISDPKTTPDSRAGRILFAALVATGAWYVQFKLFRTNGLLWSLAASSLLVPLIDKLLPSERYQWNRIGGSSWPALPQLRLLFSPGLLPHIRSVASTWRRATRKFSTAPLRSSSSAMPTAP
jgi:Na+-transporting NADH:ubiquinone oxidoreductase subunit NqrB